MARKTGSLPLSSNIEVEVGMPLDARAVVSTASELVEDGNFRYRYVGMIVAVQDTGNVYVLTDKDYTTFDNWKLIGSGGDSNYDDTPLKTRLDALEAIPPYDDSAVLEEIRVLKNKSVKYTDFDENRKTIQLDNHNTISGLDTKGTGHNLVMLSKWDVADFGAAGVHFNLNTKDTVTINDSKVVATLDDVSEVSQSVTELSERVSVIEGDDSLSTLETRFSELNTKVNNLEMSSSAGGLANDLTVTQAVGGIASGTTFAKETPIETILRQLLNPVLNPAFTAPSATISANKTLLEAGKDSTVTLTVTFSRGKINPAYGTSGFRSGAATGYSLNGSEAQSTNTFTVVASEANKTFSAVVTYDAGEQPKNSIGENFGEPLAAGSVTTNTLTLEFVHPVWSNVGDITTVAKMNLVSKSAKSLTLTFPDQTVANPEILDIPSSWNIMDIQTLNELSNQWESVIDEFTPTTVEHEEVAYTRYTDNRGYAAGSRKIKVLWS